MKCLLILNPGSHAGRSRKKFDRIFRLLTVAGIRYDSRITRSLKDAYDISLEMNGKGYDAIIAVGGDGTINAVINGFFNNEGVRRSGTKFGVIYTGTSPDFCKSYNIPTNLKKAVERIITGKTIKIPIGKIILSFNNTGTGSGAGELNGVRYFACCANIGLGAALARRANSGIRKGLGDFAGTFVSLIATLIFYKANSFVRVVDGKTEKIERMFNTSVGLTPFIASGIKIHHIPEKHPGMFYCMTVKQLKPGHILRLLKKVYSGKPFSNSNYLSIVYYSKIEFYKNDLNPELEFDGDPAGYLPCKIEIAKDTLDLLA